MFTFFKKRLYARLLCGLVFTLAWGAGGEKNFAQARTGAWTRQSSGTLAWFHSVYFLDAERGWAVGGNGRISATTDGGRTWRAKRPPADDTLHDVFFTDSRTGWLVCERSIYKIKSVDEPRGYLLKTTDGGETWTRVEVTKPDVILRLRRVVFADGAHGWTFGEAGTIYATADGGASWTKQFVPTRHLLLGASFLDNRQGWIVGGSGSVLWTADGGAQWRGIATNPDTRSRTIAGTPGATRAGDTTTAAASQTPTQPRPRLNAVSFVDNKRGWAVGVGGTVVVTADGGRTWRNQNSNTDLELLDVKFLSAAEGWAVGAEGMIIHTTDGGRVWQTEPSGVTHTLERVSFVNGDAGWAVGFGGTIIARVKTTAPPRLRSVGER